MHARTIKRIHEIAYHRNGISGEPFYIVRFAAYADYGTDNMLAVVFPEYDDDGEQLRAGSNPRVAVFDETLFPTIAFGKNSWRGDTYADGLIAAINAYNARA